MKPFLTILVAVLVWWALWPQSISSHGSVTTTVLFDREIVRILSNRCVMCHEEGGLSFPLETYEQTWLRGRAIRTGVLRRHMPPWPAVAGYGQFANDNSLTLRETQFLLSWIDGLGPRNAGTVFLNVPKAPGSARKEVRAASHAGHRQLGEPHLTRVLEANTIEAGQRDLVRRTVIDLGLTSARHVTALEYVPGDRRVVRAVSFSLQQTGQWLGSWTPWYGLVKLPEGVGHRLPAGSRVVAEIHYRGASERVVDRGTLGLFFSDRELKTASDLVLEARNGRATARLQVDTHVWALRPTIVPGIESLEVSARKPDGGTDVLLFAREPSNGWPTPYILKNPVLLKKGSQLSLVARGAGVRLTVGRY